jgi:hypothetical protein
MIVFIACVSHAQKPNIHGAKFKVDCKECHTSGGWDIDMTKFNYNHDSTGFVLKGVHQNVDCILCHKTLVFNEARSTCVSCHTDVHSMSVGNDCARCHTAASWLVDNIPELHEQNGFALAGAHTVLSCADCHKSETTLRWDRIGNDCISCHRKNHESARQPNHTLSNFSLDCINCHDPNSKVWGTDNFHSQFPLTLGHEIDDCKACHTSNDYAAASSECVTCHRKNFDNAVKPNHAASGYSTNCVECHSQRPFSWEIKDFHLNFSLTLGHDVADCKKCHKSADYKNISTECVSCHLTAFENSGTPPHLGSGFSTNCTECHSATPLSWTVPGYHSSYPLTLGHNVADCKACHKTNNYPATSTECVTCHKTDFDNTTNPAHLSSGFSTNCIECHSATPSNWDVPNFHLTFPLTLGHDVPVCKSCHKGVDYKDISKECVSCHQANFNTTTLPPHIGSGFSTNCIDCHSPTPLSWAVSGYHNSFPLTQGHNIADCKTCHKTDNYPATSTICYSCHQTNFNTTTAPPHIGSGFSTNCTDCHSASPVNWNISGYHNRFPLTLGHNVADCKACHKTDNYPATSPDCISCHAGDYNKVTLPDHKTLNFSTNCLDCHTTTPGWASDFYKQHDAQYFPINTGKHLGEWNTCTDCHTNSSNYKVFTCIDCHKHSTKTDVDKDHENVGGYSYTSNACYSCHPDGKN